MIATVLATIVIFGFGWTSPALKSWAEPVERRGFRAQKLRQNHGVDQSRKHSNRPC